MKWVKYEALGNDYLVMEPQLSLPLTSPFVAQLCHRRRGLGADGVLMGPKVVQHNHFDVDIYNADGSSAEISGNGMTIFATYLLNEGYVSPEQVFFLHPSPHCQVQCRCFGKDDTMKVDVTFGRGYCHSSILWKVPATLRQIFALPTELQLYSVDMGNPHCVVPVDEPTPLLAQSLGPILECHPAFPQRTNVQFVSWSSATSDVVLEIWERGSGYTLGSGSSACAAACAYFHCHPQQPTAVKLHMPGGRLEVYCHQGVFSFVNQAHRVLEALSAYKKFEEKQR